MERNFSSGISHLDRLLEKHKQLQERSVFKSYYQSHATQNNVNIDNINNYQYQAEHNTANINNMDNYQNQNLASENKLRGCASKVYVNPNYTKRKPVIHINPHIQIKPSIYVNPKLIQNITKSQYQDVCSGNTIQNSDFINCTNTQSKCSVYVNPKLMNKLISKATEETQMVQQNTNINDAVNSTHNITRTNEAPTLQSKSDSPIFNVTCSSNVTIQNNSTSSSVSNVKKKVFVASSLNPQKRINQKPLTNYVMKSKTKLVKLTNSLKRSPNTSFIALSRRKLVRIKKSTKIAGNISVSPKQTIPLQRRLSNSGVRKTKTSPKSVLSSVKSVKSINAYKLNSINTIDRALLKLSCRKNELPSKKVLTNTGLVSIGGIMYKKSRNQLVRSNSSASLLKRKRNLTSNKNCEYYVTKNGKKLLKLDSTVKKVNSSFKKSISPTTTKWHKTNISNKVKQRSLQILRNKMRKNNQPCLLFQRFGYCANRIAGTCPKVHDRKQVALCKNFLQGKCLLDDCPLSHDVGPEKMPTCKYFLEGCCTRDGCPYLHVKVSSKNPICVEFLRGYCQQGNECQNRHIFVCPEYDKSSKCSKGKSCPYPHKSKLTEIKRIKGDARRKNTTLNAKQSEKKVKLPVKSQPDECRKRYYENINDNQDNNSEQDLNSKRKRLFRSVEIMKNVHDSELVSSIVSNEKQINIEHSNETNTENISDSEEKQEIVCNRPRRPPIGSLPAYIPID